MCVCHLLHEHDSSVCHLLHEHDSSVCSTCYMNMTPVCATCYMNMTPVLCINVYPCIHPSPTPSHPRQVCREYQRGNCSRGENDCRFSHPSDSTMIDTNDNTVTVCMDYIKGRCSREKCKYFHPPAHLQAKIKAAQHQVNQATAAAAMGIPHSVMPPMPKRAALEKPNGASAMFNTGMLQYQHALANMQFQQQAAFLPSGSIFCMTPTAGVVPMMHGGTQASAASTSATSVPFATSSANQDSSLSKLTTNEYMQLIPIISADHLSSHKYLTQM
ncbi:unnamed protein product [Oncorhynchus mykiss]|uniref:C3H1-type domain-containing protein n=1 Tax=Oncorhynchus mykiss TaxID=8022 RepID=A0A060XTB1_ONCMY|nr:unnamed protein product [Oncorhynchus mykiss]